MPQLHPPRLARFALAALALALLLPGLAPAQDEGDDQFTAPSFEGCTFANTGSNPYFPLRPGTSLYFEGEDEDDEGGLVDVSAEIHVLTDTEVVAGVRTRVIEERESEDGDIVEISRNFFAICRETGDVWYFGEDVDIYEDGAIISHAGAWRAGQNGAQPGIFMPGTPLLGARFFQELAPGVALDRSEIMGLGEDVTVPAGSFENVLEIEDTNALDPSAEGDEKIYAPGVGLIADEVLELVDVTFPPCLPDATTLCLHDGRFRVTAEWADSKGHEGDGRTVCPADDTGEFWFFTPNNTELIVKVLDACDLPGFNSFWVFAGGLTNVEVTLVVTDTLSMETREYHNDFGVTFEPIVDTSAFFTCDAGE